MVLSIISFSVGILSGYLINLLYTRYQKYRISKKILEGAESIFESIFSRLLNDGVFCSRINDIVTIASLNTYISYDVSTKSITILDLDGKYITDSSKISDESFEKYYTLIDDKFKNEINNTMVLFGSIVSSNLIDTSGLLNISNMSLSDILNSFKSENIDISISMSELSDELNNLSENDDGSLKLDDILDKISKNGIESLSENEKEFLDNISKS